MPGLRGDSLGTIEDPPFVMVSSPNTFVPLEKTRACGEEHKESYGGDMLMKIHIYIYIFLVAIKFKSAPRATL